MPQIFPKNMTEFFSADIKLKSKMAGSSHSYIYIYFKTLKKNKPIKF